MLASQIFPGPHSQTSAWSSTEMELVTTETNNLEEAVITGWSLNIEIDSIMKGIKLKDIPSVIPH